MSVSSDISQAHEEHLALVLGGRRTRGSGNQFANQMDGRHDHREKPWAFAWDGKASLGESIGVSRAMWRKAEDQAHGERPMLALRYYNTPRSVDLDLVTLGLDDFAEMREAAVKWDQAKKLLLDPMPNEFTRTARLRTLLMDP